MGQRMNPDRGRDNAVEIAVARGIAAVEREQWNALLGDDDSPFLDWDWLYAMEESKSAARATGWMPYHLLVRHRASQALVAACPLYLKTHSMGEFVFDHEWAEAAAHAKIRYYPKLLVGVPFTPHTGRRFLTALGVERGPMVEMMGRALVKLCADNRLSSVHVNFIQEDEAAILSRIGFLERLGYQYHWRNAGFYDFDGYLASLKHKRRAAVRHERAALEDQGVTIRVLSGDEIPDSAFAPAYRLYLSTVDKFYWGRRHLTAEFFQLVGERLRRHVCLMQAWRGRRLLAGTFNIEKAGVLYGRYWGCFCELKFLHFNVCYYAGIEHCIERGLRRFEPGAGGEYKWLRGFDPALTRSAHFIADPSLARAVADFLKRERREIKAWVAEAHERSQLRLAPAPPSNAEAR
jgi:uncharacterized protein